MSQSVYSYYGSRLHLYLEDEIAEGYNRFMDSWYKAQQLHRELHEREWDPKTEPLLIDYESKDKKAYDDVGRIINLLVEINGGGLEIPEEETTEDYLVKVE